MPQGKAVIEDVQWIVIQLSATMPPEDIAAYTNLSECKVRGIISHFNRTGDVKVPTCERPRLQRSLRDEDIKVCEFVSSSYPTDLYKHLFDTLSCMPDLYLDELWLELQQTSGVDVSISTIWRTLVKGGFSMKKVSGMLMPMAETYIPNSSLVLLLNVVLKSGQTLLLALVPTRQISWYLLMRALLIVEQLIVEGLGLYRVIKQQGSAFSVVEKGKCR